MCPIMLESLLAQSVSFPSQCIPVIYFRHLAGRQVKASVLSFSPSVHYVALTQVKRIALFQERIHRIVSQKESEQ